MAKKKEKSKLFYEKKFVWETADKTEKKDIMEFAEGYKKFMDVSKTERKSVEEIVKKAEANGFKPFNEIKTLKAGTKFYAVNKGKMVAMFIMGSDSIEEGMNIVGSHIDCPRLDLKQVPLYEDAGMAMLKTHYYGGIRKYQWVARPLALYGTIMKADGEIIDIAVGDNDDDPVFYISDLLPHLAKDQAAKKLNDAIEGENLNVIVGGLPFDDDDESDKFKRNILELLFEKYGIIEEDFVSAEIEVVPAGKSRDVGFDRSFISAHGHDDRVCAYPCLEAMFEVKGNKKTAVGLYVDKEEIGSVGNTGMHSQFFNNLVAEVIAKENKGKYNELLLRRSLENSNVLSSDVAAAFDPNYAGAYEKTNSAIIGKGVTMCKYTGSRGKSGCNDANAEFVGKIRRLFNGANVAWQTSELGKVDQGGGGTIAYILANYNMNVIDFGVPVIAMHAPVELISKTDLYSAYKGYKAFMNDFE